MRTFKVSNIWTLQGWYPGFPVGDWWGVDSDPYRVGAITTKNLNLSHKSTYFCPTFKELKLLNKLIILIELSEN